MSSAPRQLIRMGKGFDATGLDEDTPRAEFLRMMFFCYADQSTDGAVELLDLDDDAIFAAVIDQVNNGLILDIDPAGNSPVIQWSEPFSLSRFKSQMN